MEIKPWASINNDCYKNNKKRIDSRYRKFQDEGPKGLMLHSIGTPQPNAAVLAKHWNQSGLNVAVHAVLQADGTVFQCLPWNYRGWHAGGSANNTHIGVEMTEPDCIKYVGGATFKCSDKESARNQVRGTYETAVELFAYLCKQYNLDPMKAIIGHAEGHRKGIASNHGDPEHLWKQLGLPYSMDTFRRDVSAKLKGTTATTNSSSAKPVESLKVGAKVKLKTGATYYDGKSIPSWLFKSTLYVRSINKDRVVVSTMKTGPVTGAINKKWLTLI